MTPFENYLSALKQRLNLQVLGNYIRDGSTKVVLDPNNFSRRETAAFARLEAFLTSEYGSEAEAILDEVGVYATTVQEIYFNLGMKAGATLQQTLTNDFETDL